MQKIRLFYLVLFLLFFQHSNLFSKISLREKVGQMIMVGFYGTEIHDSLLYDIEHRNLGGVVTLAYNLDNPRQIKKMIADLQQKAAIPLLMAVDQEGGKVARLDEQNGYSETYTAYELGTVFNSEDSTRKQAAEMTGWLRDGGFNVNLAPVVDVNVNPSSPAIGKHGRSFSNNAFVVADHAGWFIDEFHQQNIINTLKHFPGHGSAEDDSHLGFTNITDTWSEDELIPYSELISNGFADIVMTGHLYNAHIDSVYPATLSHNAMTGLLRDSLGFEGMVISDAMYMHAIVDNYEFDEAIELAINAGVDMLLYTTNMRDDRSLPGMIIDLVEEKVRQGRIAESRIDEAYQNIIGLKQKYLGYSSIKIVHAAPAPEEFEISVYPNPFNNQSRIQFSLAKSKALKITLYNSAGQVVRQLANREYAAGSHTVTLDGARLASGIYFIRLLTPDRVITRKITLIK